MGGLVHLADRGEAVKARALHQHELALLMTDDQLEETRERCATMLMHAMSALELETADAILDAVEEEIIRRKTAKRIWS